MRYFLLLFLGVLFFPALGQRISGRITDLNGNAIEYVNVGIANTSTGGISDRNGNFSIRIPDSLKNKQLLFSHLSYKAQSLPIPELFRQMSETGEVTVALPVHAFAIAPVVVLSGRARYRRFEKTYRSAGGYIARSSIDTAQMENNEVARINAEIGTVYTMRNRIWLKTITLHVSRCSQDSVLMRVNLFRYEDRASIKALLHKPIYIMVRKDLKEAYYDIDVEADYIVLERGEVAVGLDVVERYGHENTYLLMPHYTGGGYRRRLLSDFVEKSSRNPGISLYGRILPD